MLKLPKGLKKKKKGKKSKHKEDELFKPEELEAYRREHQQHADQQSEDHQQTASGDSGGGEEWKKFLALTSGVDDILKKTQGDLDRIKSTSFFQRVPPPSEVRRQEEVKEAEVRAEEEAKEEEKRIQARVEAAIVEVSDSETEDEDEDDIFDTAYIDAVAAGEVKLAYIPESPTDEPDDDPFDTTYAEKAILGPNAERKGKKLVPLGSAVEILTGRVQAPTCVPVKRPVSKRQVFKEKDLLLGSFDAAQGPPEDTVESPSEHQKPSLLDDDAPAELANEPIDLSKVIVTPVCAPPPLPTVESEPQKNQVTDILEEFDVLQKVPTPEDEDDLEFALLAAESLSKPKQATSIQVLPSVEPQEVKPDNWNAFGEEKPALSDGEDDLGDDPFDTTFAENILPGQAELKQIEKEILNTDNDLDFNPRADEVYSEIIRRSSVSIQLTNPSGDRESLSSLDRLTEDELKPLNTTHRDLLGGSNTDLSQLGEAIQPKETSDDENFDFSDPFDTSAVEGVTLPGSTELKFLERELLGDIKEEIKAPQPSRPPVPVIQQVLLRSPSDDEFDPRAFDAPIQPPTNRKVSFDLPLNKIDLLSAKEDDSKASKPLTPYYVRDNSIPEQELDPFDTTFAEGIAPGEAELKQIESELFSNDFNNSCDFNPRDEKQLAVAKVVQEIEELSKKPPRPQPPIQTHFEPEVVFEKEPLDLLGVDNDIGAEVLKPAAEITFEEEDIDPFDTSIASNILPGQTELRLLESELITNSTVPIAVPTTIPIPVTQIKRNLTDPEFDPRETATVVTANLNLLEAETGHNVKPLTPITGRVNFEIGFDDEEDDIDPFDTSIANNIGPGPSELKLLESELI